MSTISLGWARRARYFPSLFGRLANAKGRTVASILAAGAILTAPAQAQRVRITALSDINFGTINNLVIDAVRAQNVCVYTTSPSNGYNIRADGSGAGGAYALSNGSAVLTYDVRWSDQAGQLNGAVLSPGAFLGGQTTNSQNQTCSSGPPTTASLVVTLPAASLSSATEGSYSGTLTLIVAPE